MQNDYLKQFRDAAGELLRNGATLDDLIDDLQRLQAHNSLDPRINYPSYRLDVTKPATRLL